ncbi:hemagglutinin repeat-containing protein [Volucribacter amazonae]|uniref:Filamentous haemagglutinin FhaB/tRNA nuclease CdiA-like TPS domain-containing protein n=1 Tax=Volucribacter amazonae TaxID=256731 RepID=A0A9X4P8W6_9PAST|nr:hypothetical protein [Volucribacter amazonae]
MNKQYFRVIFSKTLQRLVVVSELAKSSDKSTSNKQSAVNFKPILASLTTLGFHLFCALGFVTFSMPVLADTLIIKADPNAPKNQQPIVLQTANGLPQVNIQTPNNKGLSHNKYQDFNVDNKGAILNNSHKAIQTQQAGFIQGNPYLAKGEAKVILNEVTSNNPSQLKGYLEVAGRKAEIIIANPNGLYCDGCGTINASRATMTTGKPQIKEGQIDSFVVEKGKIKVSGKGLDNSRVDYTDILARETEINAGIWTNKKLNVVTGKNTIKQASLENANNELQITRISAENINENTPLFALDVSELGGMYAGKIHLVGTEQGLGVRNAGHIGASADTLTIDSQGKIVNQGIINAQQQISLNAHQSIENHGRIENKTQDILLNANENINQAGSLIAQTGTINAQAKNISQSGESLAKGKINYNATEIKASQSSLFAAGITTTQTANGETLQLDKQSAQGSAITLKADNHAQLAGRHIASGDFAVTAQSIDLDNSQNHAYNIKLKAQTGNVTANKSQLSAVENLKISTPKTLSTQHSQLSANHIQTAQQDLNTQNSVWQQHGTADFELKLRYLQNQGGVFSTAGNFNLNAKEVDNTGGQLIAGQHFNINLSGELNSTQGVLFANKSLNLTSGQLTNTQGLIKSLGDMQINTHNDNIINQQTQLNSDTQQGIIALGNLIINSANLDNTTGTIFANNTLNIVTNTLNNQLGTIGSPDKLVIDTQQSALNNQQGQIFANITSLSTGEINNQQGLLRGDKTLTIDTHNRNLNNQQTQQSSQGILGLGTVILNNINQLNNTQGKIASAQDLNINTATLDNNKGLINAQQALIQAEQINNQAGTIWATDTHLNANVVNNQYTEQNGSLIGATNKLNITATQLNNQQTIATSTKPTQGLQGKNIQLNVAELNNQQGGIYATNTLATTINQQLNNQAGELLAGQVVNIDSLDRHLVVDNQNGTIEAGQQLNLTAKTLQHEGTIKTQGDAEINLTDSFTLNQALQVGNNLTFTTQGNFTNNVKQVIGNQAIFNAINLLNPQHAEISSNRTIINATSITNYGLLDGSENIIKTQTLNNLGTGRIYGNHLAIQANNLNNLKDGEKSATIAARERLDLAVGTLTNRDHSLIFSQGDLAIGGQLNEQHQAEGYATFIDNGSATIEALGNGEIKTERLLNHDLYLTLGEHHTDERIIEYAPSNSSTRYATQNKDGGEGYFDLKNNHRRDSNSYFVFRNGKRIGSRYWTNWNYNRHTVTSTIEHRDPAQILIAGNLSLTGTDLENNASTLSVGKTLLLGDRIFTDNTDNENLTSGNTSLRNIDIEGTINVTDTGRWESFGKQYRRYGIRGRKRWAVYGNGSGNINEIHPVQHFSFNKVLNNIGSEVASTNTSIHSQSSAQQITLKNLNYSLPVDSNNITASTPSPVISGQISAISPENLAKGTLPVIKTHLTPIRLPQASLYQINPDAPNGYLVETDRQFTDRKQWLSSDYMFTALRYDHNNVQKRLGDGFYEQRLVNEQIQQLTGRRFLDNYSSDFEQYKALMNNGIYYANKFNLTPGIGLTANQMAQLTSDMVWFVNQPVTLADGTTLDVLTPQVYLVSRNTEVTTEGALISAREIVAEVNGDIHNSGTIAGRDLTALSAQNITQQGNLFGNNVNLLAEQKLINLGGKIQALESATLVGKTGVNIASTTSSSANNDAFGNQFAHTHLDKQSNISTNGTLTIYSPQDVVINAANMAANVIHIQGDNVELATINTSNKQHYNGDADNYYRLDQQQEIGSQLNAQSDIQIVSQHNTTLRQASLHSDNGTIALQAAQGDIHIQEGRHQEQLDFGAKSSQSGFLQKTTTVTKHLHQYDMAQGSAIDADNIVLQADKGNIRVQGSSVVAENQLVASANNIDIQHAENQIYQQDVEKTSKSGLMGSGGFGFSVGLRKNTTENDQTRYYASQSQVGSLTGDTTLLANEQYRQTASAVTAVEGDVNIQAKQVDILATSDKYDTNYKQTYEKKGLTIAINTPIQAAINAIESVNDAIQTVGESKDDRINAMAAANAGWTTLRAGQTLGKIGKELGELMQNGTVPTEAVSVSITYGQQKNVNTQHTEGTTANNSQVNAGGKVSILATGADKQSNIHIIGSDVSGKQGTTLVADNDIHLLAQQQNHMERSKNQSFGFNAGVAVAVGNGVSFGITAGGNYGKGYGNGDEITYRNTHIGDSASQTIIQAGNNATLKGAQVQGKSVALNAQNLTIESLQDTMKYEGKQMNVSGQVTVGYGASGSASYNQSRINADYASVVEQSGIYAGDEGYQINIANHTELVGGMVTSTQKAELANKNHFSTGTLASQNIENHSNYKGSAFGVAGSMAFNADLGLGKHAQAQSDKQAVNDKGEALYTDAQGQQTTQAKGADGKANSRVLASGGDSLKTSMGVGFGYDSDSQSSITQSGINTKNIYIRNEQEQLEKTGKTLSETLEAVKTNIVTESAVENTGILPKDFDKERVQKELNTQVKVTQELDKNRQEIKAKLYSIVDSKRALATSIRKENGGYDTNKSEKLDAEAKILDEQIRWLDMGLGLFIGSAGNSNTLWGMFATTQADRVLRSATAPKEMWYQKCPSSNDDCTGKQNRRQIWSLNDLTNDERANLEIDNNVLTISNPGIFNDRKDALKNAQKQNTSETNQKGIIVVMNPPTGRYDGFWLPTSLVSELMYAAYDKLNDKYLWGALPLTNSQKLNQDLYRESKQLGYKIDLNNHSRGGLTASIALQDINIWKQEKDIPIRKARFYGTATNVESYANQLQRNGYSYQNEKTTYQSGAYSAVHESDFVGNKWLLGLVGNNNTTGGNCLFCYSHSSYYAEIPDPNLQKEKYNDFISIWGTPLYPNDNPSLPKLVKPTNQEKGGAFDENPF